MLRRYDKEKITLRDDKKGVRKQYDNPFFMNVKGLCPLLEGSRRVFVDLLETQTHSPTAQVSVHICTLPESDTRTNTPRQM